MTDYLELQGRENEDALLALERSLDRALAAVRLGYGGADSGAHPAEGGLSGYGGTGPGAYRREGEADRFGHDKPYPYMRTFEEDVQDALEMEEVLSRYGGAVSEMYPVEGHLSRYGGVDSGVYPVEGDLSGYGGADSGVYPMEDVLSEHGEADSGAYPLEDGLSGYGGAGSGAYPREGDANRFGHDKPLSYMRASKGEGGRQFPLLEELERLERVAGSLPGPGAALRQTGGSDLSAGTRSGGGRYPLPADGFASPVWTGPGVRSPSPAGELDRAELVDRAFQRDSRRYDGGFYLY